MKISLLHSLVVPAGVLASCASSGSRVEPGPEPAAPAMEHAAPNRLTDAERAEGWKLLFDGRTTHGWRGYKSDRMPDGWRVVDGALARVAEAGDIVTEEEFGEFELAFEWRISPGGNSGVMFHVTEDHEYPWETGPEYQILDDAGHADGADPRTSAGSNYAMHAVEPGSARPAGEWNQSRLTVVGTHVEHWLNGRKVVEYDLWSPDWKRRVAECKWKDRPDYGMREVGRIALQDHGDEVAYRSLKVRILDHAFTR